MARGMEDGLCLYDQDDPRWADIALGEDARLSLAYAGCGIFSFCNAVHALNACRPDAVAIARWALSIGAFRPEGAGLYRALFYDNVEEAYGHTLGFTLLGQHWGCADDERLKAHLAFGGTAVAHVPNHFLALVGYDVAQDRFHVLESSCSLRRFLRKESWVDAERLCRGATNVDWYVLFAPRAANVSCD